MHFFRFFIKFHLKLARQVFHTSFSCLWTKLFVSVDVDVGRVTETSFCRYFGAFWLVEFLFLRIPRIRFVRLKMEWGAVLGAYGVDSVYLLFVVVLLLMCWWMFAFWHWIYILDCLIFPSGFVIYLIFFLTNYSRLLLFDVCRFLSVLLPRFFSD